MHRYGIKLNSGKVIWVLADDIRVQDGILLFLKICEGKESVVAGFNVKEVNHFARPEVLTTAGAVSSEA